MNEYIEKLIKLGIEFGIGYIILGSIFSGIVKQFFRLYSNQSVYNDILKSARVKNIIHNLAENKIKLDASHVIITRIHNGMKWLNGNHMHKLSVYNTLTMFKKTYFSSMINDLKISELYDLLENVCNKNYDIVSVAELPNNSEYKQVLKSDKIKYLIIFKIQKEKKILGYIFVTFNNEKIAKYDKEIFESFVAVSREIAEEFN
jgi:hypothetical protein